MANRSNDEGLHDRINRLEDKFDKQSADLLQVNRNLGTVEGKIDGDSNRLTKLDETLDDLRTLVLKRTSPSRTVTWKQLIGFTSALVFVMAPLLSLLVTAVYAWYLPQRIERVVSNSDMINTHFVKLVNGNLDDRLKPTNATLLSIQSSMEENTKGIRDELKAIKSAVKTTVTRKGVVETLKHHTGSSKTLHKNLSEVYGLLDAVEDLKIPLQRQDYKDLSTRLYSHYVGAKESQAKNEFLTTFIKAANAKSVSEPTLHTVPEAEITRAKKANNYFEGTVDLSTRPEWTGAIFNKCTIEISKPEVPVILRDVRFLECNFDSIAESPPIRDLLSTYLESTRPTVTFPGYKVLVNYSIGKPVVKPRR